MATLLKCVLPRTLYPIIHMRLQAHTARTIHCRLCAATFIIVGTVNACVLCVYFTAVRHIHSFNHRCKSRGCVLSDLVPGPKMSSYSVACYDMCVFVGMYIFVYVCICVRLASVCISVNKFLCCHLQWYMSLTCNAYRYSGIKRTKSTMVLSCL